MRCKEYAILLAALFPVTAASFSATAFAAITDNWTDGNGNWSTPANWSANLAPAAGDTVNIAFSSGASRTITYDYTGANITLASLTVDLSGVAFTNAILTQAANNLSATTETIGAGSISPNDGGIFNQSGGTNTTATLFFGSTTNGKGSYNLSGSGTLTTTATEYLGYNGSGTFTQSGGAHIISGGGNSFFIGYNANAVGSYSLTAGSLAVTGYEILGYLGTGSMNQSGGTHTVAPGYYFSLGSGGGSGSYTLSGTGNLTSSSSEYVGSNGSGTFTQNGGTNTITAGNFLVIANLPGSTGNYTLTAGTATINGNAYVGGGNTTAGGTGTLNIQGGAMTIAGTLKIWNTPNSFVNFSGGSLTLNALDTSANPAHFNWTAGSLILNNDLFQNSSAAATFPNSFALNANQSLSVQNAYIGDTGTGTFTQNGGAFTVNNSNGLIIGGRTSADASAVGTYNFNGGTFTNTSNIPILVGNYGHGAIDQTTGNLNLIALFVGYQAGAVGTVNQSGGSLTSTNSLILGFSGTGSYNLSTGNLSTNDATLGFDVTGSGTMTQTGGNFSVQTNVQLAFSPGSSALYTLSAGSLTVPGTLFVGIGGAATFTQTGGTLTDTNQNGLVISRNAGSSGNYTLSGTGVATFSQNASVGGDMFNGGATGLLNIQGGAMTVVGTLKVWNTANTALNFSGGSLAVGALDTNANPARFHWTAGSLTIDNFLFFDTTPSVAVPFGNSLTLNASQSLALTSTGNHYENLGAAGSSLTQNGGTNSTPSLFIGSNPASGVPATYFLNAGALTIGAYEAIASGNPVTGIFNQTGGTNTAVTLILGDTPSSTGTFNLTGGTATFSSSALLGSVSGGAGILNIQGGAMTVATLNLYNSPGTALNFTGGSLTINTLNTFGNPSRFSWTGGTLNLISLLIDSSGPLGTSLTLTPGKILNNAATLTNNGALTLAGGSLSSTGLILNNTSLSGFGTIAGSAGITNNGLLTHAGGNLLITNTGLFTNNANIQLAPGYLLQLTGGNLTNFAFLDLHGASVTGTATLINNPSGTLAGSGAVLTPFTNNGLITLDAGNLQLPSFTNNGTIELAGPSAGIGPSGTITNAANIQGHGKISMAVINNATIEATGGGGGTLILTGSLTNSSSGTLRASVGNKILLQSGAALTNAGLIDLAGGTLDTSNQPLNNTSQITGYGILSTGGLTNNATLTLTGGTTTIIGPVTNAAGKTILAKNFPAIFTGNITNLGTIKTTSTTVTFTGNYSGNAYISDPSTNIFQANATTLPAGLMTGSAGDAFIFNTFTNNGTFTNGGNLSVSTSITNTATFTQSGPQTWLPGATFTNTSGTAAFQSNAKLYALTITAGTVDITDAKFIIEVATNKAATLSALQANVANHSLISSALPTNFGLALLDNALLNKPTFGGNPADSNSLLLSQELLGDANADGHVDLSDLSVVLNNFGSTTPAWTSGNFDNQPTIDLTDLSDVLNNFGLNNPTAFTVGGTFSAPEPSSLAVCSVAYALFLRRQIRSRKLA